MITTAPRSRQGRDVLHAEHLTRRVRVHLGDIQSTVMLLVGEEEAVCERDDHVPQFALLVLCLRLSDDRGAPPPAAGSPPKPQE